MDEIDRASEIEQARIAASLHAIKRTNLDVAPAIECIDCDEEIDEDRRKAVPSARRCFKCQELYERPRRVKRF